MNVEAIPRFVQRAPFREIVWLAPGAYAVHIAEELVEARPTVIVLVEGKVDFHGNARSVPGPHIAGE